MVIEGLSGRKCGSVHIKDRVIFPSVENRTTPCYMLLLQAFRHTAIRKDNVCAASFLCLLHCWDVHVCVSIFLSSTT